MNLKSTVPAALLLVSLTASAGTIYDNSSNVKPGDFAYSFGSWPFYSPTVGQLFNAPLTDNVLNDFTLYFATYDSPLGRVRGYIGGWTGTSIGSIIYTSDWTPMNVGSLSLTFSPNVPLNPGGSYVAFLSCLGMCSSFFKSAPVVIAYSQPIADGTLGNPGFNSGPGAIPGGAYVVNNTNNDDPSLLTDSAVVWSNYGRTSNAKFLAHFSASATAAPEPASLFLIGTALVGLGIYRYRRSA